MSFMTEIAIVAIRTCKLSGASLTTQADRIYSQWHYSPLAYLSTLSRSHGSPKVPFDSTTRRN